MSAAYDAVRLIYEKSPGRGWSRLNGALAGTLEAAIIAHLPFAEEDFTKFAQMGGHYWMGNSDGHYLGERFYTLAIEVGHMSACLAFEKDGDLLLRLGPAREEIRESTCGALVGSVKYSGTARVGKLPYMGREALDREQLSKRVHSDSRQGMHTRLLLEFLPCKFVPHIHRRPSTLSDGEAPKRTPDRIVKIRYEELRAKRKEYERVRRLTLSLIEKVETAQELECIKESIEAALTSYRHFDLEDIATALHEKSKKLTTAQSEQERLARWMSGAWTGSFFEEIRLRVRGESVEVSNGQRVTLDEAKRALAVIRTSSRKKLVGQWVGPYEIERVTPETIKIGCTIIPWSEVERIAPALEGASTT